MDSQDTANIMNFNKIDALKAPSLLTAFFVQHLQRPDFLLLKYPKAICFLNSTFWLFLSKETFTLSPPFLSKT